MKLSFEIVTVVGILLFMAATFVLLVQPTTLSNSLSVYEESKVMPADSTQTPPVDDNVTPKEINVLPEPFPEQSEPKPADSNSGLVIPAGTVFCPEEVQAGLMCLDVYEPVCGTMKSDCIGTSCAAVTKTFGNGCGACQNIEVFSYILGECGGGFATY